MGYQTKGGRNADQAGAGNYDSVLVPCRWAVYKLGLWQASTVDTVGVL